MTLPIFLIGASSEHRRVELIANQLDACGHVEITHRWWPGAASWSGRDRTLPAHEQRVHSNACKQGIQRAALVWCLFPEAYSHGALYELGYAEGLGKPVYVSGPNATATIHTSGFNVLTFYSDETALNALITRASNPLQWVT